MYRLHILSNKNMENNYITPTKSTARRTQKCPPAPRKIVYKPKNPYNNSPHLKRKQLPDSPHLKRKLILDDAPRTLTILEFLIMSSFKLNGC